MAQHKEISLQFFASGFCTAHANIVNPKECKGKTTFYAVWALIQLPSIGNILFDTGYSDEFYHATKSFPERFYRWVTPVQLKPGQSAKAILEKQNISADKINYIIISHFHADHIAGIKDFPQAHFICSKDAYQEMEILQGWRAVKKGIIHKLLPVNFKQRVSFIEDFANTSTINEFGLKEFTLFNQQYLKLIRLPGHAKGMLGFQYSYQEENIFYGTDASWSYYTYQKNILPNKMVKLFFDSWNDFMDTLEKMRAFELKNKSYKILFTHCQETLAYLSNDI